VDDLATRTAWAIERIKDDKALDKGITDVDLAKLLGTDKNTLARYRQKKGLPQGKVLERLVKHYKFNPMWFFLGQGEPFPGARDKYPDVCGPILDGSQNEPEYQSGEYVLIPQINGQISAGTGLSPDNTADCKVAFRREWIKRKGDPDKMSLIKVEGDSMDPTILSGDLVLVDHNRNYVAPQGGIYALSINHEIMIKRIHPLHSEGKLRIISDNKKYEPVDYEEERVKINGKVIWYAREIEK